MQTRSISFSFFSFLMQVFFDWKKEYLFSCYLKTVDRFKKLNIFVIRGMGACLGLPCYTDTLCLGNENLTLSVQKNSQG